MVLHTYGSEGWKTKMQSLIDRTTDVCIKLDELGMRYFRNPHINIIAIRATDISKTVAENYFLVADSYENEPQWWKIVIMPHITRGTIDSFVNDLKLNRKTKIGSTLN
jgi:tyrosine decarboxylase/aspartate 1-decarboxylase